MKVRISLEQTIDIDDAMSNDIGFELYGPKDMSNTMVKYDEVLGNISVEYIED